MPSLGYINSIQELGMLRIVCGARQYLTEIQFIILHLLASGQILKLTSSSNSPHENSREERQN